MAFTRWVVRIHKWLALIIGLQVIVWIAGGLGMALLPIDQVRGAHTIARHETPPLDLEAVLNPHEAASRAGLTLIDTVTLAHWHAGPIYRFQGTAGPVLVDANTGQRLSPLDEASARAVARHGYAGDAPITEVMFFQEPSWEYRRDHPAWRVSFADGEGTRLYINAHTGVIDARRNDMWRVFDVFWMLHIMDYKAREDFNHPLLITAAGTALIMVLAGLALLVIRMRRVLQVQRQQRRPRA